MMRNRWIVMAGSAAALTVVHPAWGQSGLDRELMKMYGGTYSAECSNASATRLRVLATELIVEQGSKLAGKNVQAAHSFFGQSAPPNYMVALVSEVSGGSQMIFIVYRDDRTQYISVDGDQRVTTALGKTLLARKFYHCDGNQRQAIAPAPAPSPTPTTASAEPLGPPDLLRDPQFRTAYFKALGAKSKEPWLNKLDGPGRELERVRVGGSEYIMAIVCKAHDCADNNTVLLYSKQSGKVYGKVFDRRRASLIGEPPAAVAMELDRLWASVWKRN